MNVELGIIEGFYGRPWSWRERAETIAFLQPYGYGFYLYCPKADRYLRRQWQEAHPPNEREELRKLSERCAQLGVRFGVGLTPFEAHAGFSEELREALARKLQLLDDLVIRDLGILFDDMRGDVPRLAERQAEIVDWMAPRTRAERIFVCPSYYTDDPVLDRAFGTRPPGYLEDLGALLDPSIEMFWTGEEVCSREFSPSHLDRVAEELRRKPFLWDNYPVNDGARMSQFLHLRAFTGRPAEIAGHIAGHGINPALQPTLTRIPALTLVESYRKGRDYAYGHEFANAAREVAGDELGELLREDLLILQDVGLDRLGEREDHLRRRYCGRPEPAGREIIAWLDGEYRIAEELVQTQ
ncbi:MAG: hyaluronidase [Gemmatimonas sp.]|nr:hyaluronidase [Gemmatimonas sp.]